MNSNDVMMMWFTCKANLVTSHWACATCVHVHGTYDLNKYGASKHPSGLAYMQADSNLAKITASHFQVVNTQNANENMGNMIPIAYLNENFIDCNENVAWGKQEPIHPYMFWYTMKGVKVVKTSFYMLFM